MVNTSPYLDPSPRVPLSYSLDPCPLSPTLLIGMEGQGGTLAMVPWRRGREPAEGLQVEKVGGGPNGGENQAVA